MQFQDDRNACDEFNTTSNPCAFDFELTRPTPDDRFVSIPRHSSDWTDLLKRHPDAFVVRVKGLADGGAADHCSRFESAAQQTALATGALSAVGKFAEFSVSETSPMRACITLLFLYGNPSMHDRAAFNNALAMMLDMENVDPYITYEMLDSFLCRRGLVSGTTESSTALNLLRQSVRGRRPVSSLFLKLSTAYSDECLELLRDLRHVDNVADLLGARSIHKLVVSCASKAAAGSEAPLVVAMEILSLGAEPKDWGYVAFNTLLRMATERHPDRQKRIATVCDIITSSSLDALDKLSLYLISELGDLQQVDARAERIQSILASKAPASASDLQFLSELMACGSPSACHLAGIILRRCADHGKSELGWNLASSITAVNKQVLSEAVHLCSKAYFSEGSHRIRQIWFARVRYCIERHLLFLNRYPCGLALHLASHARQFDLCWRWFSTMNDELAFRLTGYHTSAVLKAASYADNLDAHMPKIKQAYQMTPAAEKTTFTFVPMVRIWSLSSSASRTVEKAFWDDISRDITTMLNEGDGRHDAKMVSKLRQWQTSYSRWTAAKKDTRQEKAADTIVMPTNANARSTMRYPGPRHWSSTAAPFIKMAPSKTDVVASVVDDVLATADDVAPPAAKATTSSAPWRRVTNGSTLPQMPLILDSWTPSIWTDRTPAANSAWRRNC
ncbi:BTB domain-containing protein [Plasmodiophora brassicae]|uniref:Uncharacterized protein n=1 Tax=Plasmodiophora brassicae TaxID=37360 RepID=A0A0G4IJ70_PLABS|nr:hypothetical protein PBRA_004052 [Plasmodiophora brassicae]SPQ96267.1 unnamed protein product [Plasmodiophora brassicae]